jgi:adenylylsulfate kinase
MKILVMGLPGSGKTYLTQRLVPLLNAAWYNADQVRKMSNDWDFSDEGRSRQSMRMKTFADFENCMEDMLSVILYAPPKKREKILMPI